MKRLLIIAMFLVACEDRTVHRALPNMEAVGAINQCTTVYSFVDGSNKCYVVDYCGSGNATISCVKNEVAPSK